MDKVGVDDFLVAGGNSVESLVSYTEASAQEVGARPRVLLPREGFAVTINETGWQLGKLLGEREEVFCRQSPGAAGRDQVQIMADNGVLYPLKADQACSEFERVAYLAAQRILKSGDEVTVPSYCRKPLADQILASRSFSELLPPLRLLSRCAVLIERDGQLVTVTGYDRESGIFAAGEAPPEMSLVEARDLLLDLVSEFSFATPADKSRYLANLIGPALLMGRLADFRLPIQYNEAEESQTGKGLLHQVTAAVYGDVPAIVNQKKDGGVGSMRETFDQWLIYGRMFISFDNLTPTKGETFNSEELCSFMTEPSYLARALRTKMVVDPACHVIMATTNGCALRDDLAKRSLTVSIRKRHGHVFTRSKEQLVQYAKAHAHVLQGALFAVIREWWRSGRPRTRVMAGDSSFTSFLQIMHWIVRHTFDAAPLLEGYASVRARLTNPNHMWLRELAIAVKGEGQAGQWLTPSQLAEVCAAHGAPLPGLDDPDDYVAADEMVVKKVWMALGRKLGLCFRGGLEQLPVDSFVVSRSTRTHRGASGKGFPQKVYRFDLSSEVAGGTPEVDGEVDGKSSEVGEVGNPVMEFVDGRNGVDGGIGEKRETAASITSPGGSTTSAPRIRARLVGRQGTNNRSSIREICPGWIRRRCVCRDPCGTNLATRLSTDWAEPGQFP